jgi:hypothetical protein
MIDIGENLTFEMLCDAGVPELDRFNTLISDTNGLPMILIKEGVSVEPGNSPYFIFPDSPSAGGKTSLINNMLDRCGEGAWLIPTVKASSPSENRTDEDTDGTVLLNNNPPIEAHLTKSGQYALVTMQQFAILTDISGFFLEQKPHFGSWYGNAKIFWDKAIAENKPFSFSILDRDGTTEMISWLKTQKENGNMPDHIRESRWFLQPADLTLFDLIDRIEKARSKRQAGERIADAINDMWTSGQDSSIIILNRQETDINQKWRAADATFELMCTLRPDLPCIR